MTIDNDLTIGGSRDRLTALTGRGPEMTNARRWIDVVFRAALRDVQLTDLKRAEIMGHADRIYEDGLIDGFWRSGKIRLKKSVNSIIHRGLGATRDTKRAMKVFNEAIDQLSAEDVMNMIEETGDGG